MFADEQYLKIIEEFKKAKANMERMKAEKKYDPKYLSQVAADIKQAVSNDLNNYYDTKTKALQEKREKAKEKFASKGYEDPVSELLRRQDIERKFKLLDEDAIKELVSDMKTKVLKGQFEEKDAFYFDSLQLELKGRGLNNELYEVSAVRSAMDIDTPWNKDEEYIEASQEMLLVDQTRHTGLIWEGAGENRVVYSVKDI